MRGIIKDVHIEDKKAGCRPRVLWLVRLHLLGVLLCAIPLMNGCAFWACSGGGPMSKGEAYRIAGRAPKQMTGSEKKLAMKLYRKCQDKSGFPEKKEQVSATAVGKGLASMFTLGLYLKFESVSSEKPGGLENSLYTYDRGLIPGYPIIWPWWSEWFTTYNMENGEELGELAIHGLGLGTCLGGYACEVFPESNRPRQFSYPSNLSNKYTVKTAYHCLFGAFATGRVNHKKYLQVFWIPIPLGVADD